MFGWLSERKVTAAARHYVAEVVTRADRAYRPFIEVVVQVLADNGFGRAQGLEKFLGDERTKWHFVIAMVAEGLLAPPNLLPPRKASRFIDTSIETLSNNNGPISRYTISYDIRELLKLYQKQPDHSRLIALLYMLDKSELNVQAVQARITAITIAKIQVNSTFLNDNCGGTAKAIIGAHGLA